MLDRLFDFLRDCIGAFRFAVVLDVYEKGVILRFGRLRRVLDKPGLYWLAPFYIDRAITDTAVPTAKDLRIQSVTLRDGTSIAVGAVITYSTGDPVKFFLEVDDAESAILDAARGNVREVLSQLSWEEVVDPAGKATQLVAAAVRKSAKRWGIEVEKVSFADLSRARTYRMISGGW